MSIKKRNILFIMENTSTFDSNSLAFDNFFDKTDKALDNKHALALIDENDYDIIINDVSVEPIEGLILLKQIKEKKPDQILFALVTEQHSDKLYMIADLGVNAFELDAEHFDLALEEIGKFDPTLVA